MKNVRMTSSGVLLLLAGCAHWRSDSVQPEADPPPPAAQPVALAPVNDSEIKSLKEKVALLETQLQVYQEKEKSEKTSKKAAEIAQKPTRTLSGISPTVGQTPEHLRDGFAEDSVVALFRDGMILYESQRYGDAAATFASFIKDHGDHPMAGDAQYFLADSYSKINQTKLAEQEFNRLLVAYRQNSYVSDALKRMLELESDPAKNEPLRQQLLALFPLSPAAGQLQIKSQPTERTVASAPAPTGAIDAPPVPTAALPTDAPSVYPAMDTPDE